MSVTIDARLNAICPYFTMFPLEFPLRVLQNRASPTDLVLDPFAGRGTTNYAARLLGLRSVGIDSSPVAVALTEAKLANTTPGGVVRAAMHILDGEVAPAKTPQGDFWDLAFHAEVLSALCTLRQGLLRDCRSDARKALRGLLLGALHGPRTKGAASHLSNQCTRTYSPKPGYAVRYWRAHRLTPPRVDVIDVVRTRAQRYYGAQRQAHGVAIAGDSRDAATYSRFPNARARWIITSPPYYGMRTYVPDQWLRNWFVGGPSVVEYTTTGQLDHRSPAAFSEELRRVWENVAAVSTRDACLVIRFGGIGDRGADSVDILKASLDKSPWKLETLKPAGSADLGKRQSELFAGSRRAARTEHDAWARPR